MTKAVFGPIWQSCGRWRPIEIRGAGLSIADVVAVARHDAPVTARRRRHAPRWIRSAALVERFVASDAPVYGVTTGFGSLANTVIPPERTAELQLALVRSHAAGMGDPVEREVVRAMLLLRARSLAMARSGARPSSSTCSWRCSTPASRRSCASTARSVRAATWRRSPTARWC